MHRINLIFNVSVVKFNLFTKHGVWKFKNVTLKIKFDILSFEMWLNCIKNFWCKNYFQKQNVVWKMKFRKVKKNYTFSANLIWTSNSKPIIKLANNNKQGKPKNLCLNGFFWLTLNISSGILTERILIRRSTI